MTNGIGSTDPRVANVEVCLSGTSYHGYTVGVGQTIDVPCVTTDEYGAYSFPGIFP